MLSQCPKCSLSKSTGPMGSILPQCQCDWKMPTAQPEQEPVAWMGTDVDGNPNKFRLNFFSGAIPLFTTLEDRNLIANNEKNGSPCPEFWDWLPKAYNFDGDGTFTKYNMEVAFLAGKRSVATSDTPQERVDETVKQRHEQEPVACPYCKNSATLGAVYYDQNCVGCVKRMTDPPQRTWQGLTDEEYSQLHDGLYQQGKSLGWVVDQIEEKLKGKNHD